MFYVETIDDVTAVYEVTKENPAPSGTKIFETAEAANKAADEAIEAFESDDRNDPLVSAMAEADRDLAQHDKEQGIDSSKPSINPLLESCLLTLLHRGDMEAQLKKLGRDDLAEAVSKFKSATE